MRVVCEGKCHATFYFPVRAQRPAFHLCSLCSAIIHPLTSFSYSTRLPTRSSFSCRISSPHQTFSLLSFSRYTKMFLVWVILWVAGEKPTFLTKIMKSSESGGKKENPFVVKLDFHFEKHSQWVLILAQWGTRFYSVVVGRKINFQVLK